MSQHMRAHPFPCEGRTPTLRGVHVSRDEPFHRITAQCATVRRRKERVRWLAVAFAEPGGEHADHVAVERRAALLATFAFAAQMAERLAARNGGGSP